MSKFTRKRRKKAGLSPGTMVYVGEPKAQAVQITVFDYDEQTLQEKQVSAAEVCASPYPTSSTVTWINVDGVHQVDVIEQIGRHFGVHPLVLEDIVHTNQRPKADEFEEHLYVVLKMLTYDDTERRIQTEQVSLVLGPHYLLTFQEDIAGDAFDPVRERLRTNKGRIRKMGPDYLLYSLIDSIVDNYFGILEKMEEQIESLQEHVAAEPSQQLLHEIHKVKQEIIFLRKSIWPVREMVHSLQRGEFSLIRENTEIFLRDVYDHIIQIIDTTEALREMTAGMLDVYLSSVSNRMNAVMKVLTIIATIFIPLTFIAGVYGMNFEVMPEIKWKWGYPWLFWLEIITVLAVMLYFFRKKKWL